MKTCTFCGNKNIKETHTQYLYRHNGEMLIVNNTPCEECEFCGEQYFKASVLKQIETDFFQIKTKRKKPAQHLQIPVEAYA